MLCTNPETRIIYFQIIFYKVNSKVVTTSVLWYLRRRRHDRYDIILKVN